MATSMNRKIIEQLDDIISFRDRVLSECDDYEHMLNDDLRQLATRARAAIFGIVERSSVYAKDAVECMSGTYLDDNVCQLMGIIEALRVDIQGGYLETISELHHAELFSDFFDMADHLLSEGYKDAAAVIAGSSLESHLRLLCDKNSIPVTKKNKKGVSCPKKADAMNNELAAALVYKKMDQKNVTAWLDLRNKAAHGHYDDYSKEQVALLLQALRDFMVRNPA